MGIHNRRRGLPPFDLLPAFEAAARHLSFTKAGAELFLTQSAVSRQIQALEQALGVPLFERRTRALALTAQGRTYLGAVQDGLARITQGTRALRSTPDLRTVTLTTTPGFASLWLIPRLASFIQAHPDVDVRTSASNQIIDFARAGCDLAIRYCPEGANSGGRRLFGGQAAPVCSPRLLAESRHALRDPRDLRHYTLLYLDDPNAAWYDWNLWFHALGLRDFRPGRRLHFSHYDQTIQAAVNAQGIALGLDPLVRQLIREGRLVAPFRKAAAPPRAWYLLRSDTSEGNPDVDAFVAWLRTQIKADTALPGWRARG